MSAEFSKASARALVLASFNELVAEVDDGITVFDPDPDWHLNEQRWCAETRISDLLSHPGLPICDEGVVALAAAGLAKQGLALENLSQPRREDVLSGLSRALVEQQRLFLFRLDERLAPYQPADPLLQIYNNFTPPSAAGVLEPSEQQPVGPTLGWAITRYLTRGQERWTPKTQKSRERMLGSGLIDHNQ